MKLESSHFAKKAKYTFTTVPLVDDKTFNKPNFPWDDDDGF